MGKKKVVESWPDGTVREEGKIRPAAGNMPTLKGITTNGPLSDVNDIFEACLKDLCAKGHEVYSLVLVTDKQMLIHGNEVIVAKNLYNKGREAGYDLLAEMLKL